MSGYQQNAVRTQRHNGEERESKNILNDKSHKMKCVIKTTRLHQRTCEKDTMTAAEDIEEAEEKLL